MAIKTTQAVQDYLKALYLECEEARGPASTSAMAARLAVSPASATNMLKKLAVAGLVKHSAYRGARLTRKGRAIALEVIRHHRLLETYLAEALGVPWDEIHAEADVLEHAMSEQLEARIAERLGHPSTDPHGHPIPSFGLEIPHQSDRLLWDASGKVEIERVSDARPDVLRYLAERGLRPGALIEVVERGPVAGPLFVRTGGEVEALSQELAEAIWVT